MGMDWLYLWVSITVKVLHCERAIWPAVSEVIRPRDSVLMSVWSVEYGQVSGRRRRLPGLLLLLLNSDGSASANILM